MNNKIKALHYFLPIGLLLITSVVRFNYLELDLLISPLLTLIIARLIYSKDNETVYGKFKLNLSGLLSLAALIHILNFMYCKGYVLKAEIVTTILISITIWMLNKRSANCYNYWLSMVLPLLIYFFNFIYTKEFFDFVIVFSILALNTAYLSVVKINIKLQVLLLLVVPLLQLFYFTRAKNAVQNFIADGTLTGVVNEQLKYSVTLKDLDGNNHTLDNDSTYYIFDCWFTGCAPCWRAFPDFQKFYNQHKGNGKLDIRSINISLSTDSLKDSMAIQKIERLNYTFPVFWGDDSLEKKFSIRSYPTVVVYHNHSILFRGSLELCLDYLKSNKLISHE